MRNHCDGIGRLLSEALDDVLSSERQILVDEHLASCRDCRQRYTQMQRVQASLRGMPAAGVPMELENRIRQTWHPLLRSLPSLRLYPYLPSAPSWGNIQRLRTAGFLAGACMTAVALTMIFNFLGRFSLDFDRLAAPAFSSLVNRPFMVDAQQETIRSGWTYPEDTGAYANTNFLADSTRLNGYVLTRFADNEMGALHEDSLSVVTQVQPDGRGAIEGVLHTPRDRMLLVRFSQLLSTSQFGLPLSKSSSSERVVWSFCRIIVIS